jgi:hypothetical protein
VGGDVLVDSETLLVTDFVNLKIKSAHSFEGAHRDRVCARVFIQISANFATALCILQFWHEPETKLQSGLSPAG